MEICPLNAGQTSVKPTNGASGDSEGSSCSSFLRSSYCLECSIPSSEMSVKLMREPFFSQPRTGKSDSTVDVIGKAEAKPPQKKPVRVDTYRKAASRPLESPLDRMSSIEMLPVSIGSEVLEGFRARFNHFSSFSLFAAKDLTKSTDCSRHNRGFGVSCRSFYTERESMRWLVGSVRHVLLARGLWHSR